jgi:putative DNA primase/helicase
MTTGHASSKLSETLEEAAQLLDAALEYARGGWRVFPVGRDKKPVTSHGFKDATQNEDLIREWWRLHPLANIALDIPEGLVILDFDPRNGAPDADEVLHGNALLTLTCWTAGGGQHLYYRVPEDSQLVTKWMPGVDVKRAGLGYVLLPPSVNSAGRLYDWSGTFAIEREHIKPLPDWLLRQLTKPEPAVIGTAGVVPAKALFPWEAGTAYGIRALEQQVGHMFTAPEGERNERLNRVGFRVGQLVAAGELKGDESLRVIAAAAEYAGLDKHEVYQTLKSSFEAGLAKPWEKRGA